MTEYKAIAIKEKPKSLGEKGVVKLLFIWSDESDSWALPDETKFKAKKCFITTEYSKEIDEKYKRDEPFVLKKVNEINTELDKQGSEFAEWRCFGNQNEPLKGEYIPVVKGELPDQGSGELKLSVEVQYIFIEKDDYVYGPFQISFDNKLIATPYDKPLGLQQYHIIKAPKGLLIQAGIIKSSIVDGNEYCFVTSYADLRDEKKSDWEMDYINNSALLKYVLNERKKGEKQKSIRTKNEIAKLQSDIKETFGKIPQQERVKRALDILSRTDENIDQDLKEFEAIVNEWMSTNQGKAYIAKITADIELLEQKRESLELQIEEANKNLIALKESSAKHQFEINEYKTQINDLKDKKVILGEEQKRQSLAESEQKFKDAELKLNDIEIAINKKIVDLELVEKIESLSIEERAIVRSIDKSKKEKTQLEADIKLLESLLGGQNDHLRPKIIEHNSLLKILKSGGVIEEQQDVFYTPIKVMSKSNRNDFLARETLIKSIAKKLNSNDRRRFEEFEIANLLTCTQQNLLTILQGAPGSGKTSTAISLAKALGLCDETESSSSHFLKIAVARGWVSSRDVLGYYNSLKGSYQPAKTGLYQFLLMGEDASSSVAPRIILLDEANLSPIEHYWSDFIGMCDAEGFYNSIDTGSPSGVKELTPNKYDNLRFIATINSDETTEPLSPRLLDRAPVINMDIPHKGFFNEEDEFEIDGAIENDLFKKAFGADESKRKDINEYPRLNKFIEMASKSDRALGDSINLSMRKRNAISNYLSVAMEIMDESYAQDYAISQFVLPLLKGDKKGFDGRLNELKSIAIESGFDRSKSIIDGILDRGDQYLASYSFF